MISIGVDGGGTKTAFLCDKNGELFSLTLREAANPNTVGKDNSVDVISRGINQLCDEHDIDPRQIDGIFCGIAGATNGDYRDYCTAKLKTIFENANIAVAHDGHNILSAAFGNGDGVIVICGTGSSCFVRKNGELSRIGGYLTFDTAGCGYEIGRAAIAHSLACYDGRRTPDKLDSLVREKMNKPPLDALNTLLKSDRNAVASYAVTVYKAYAQGNKAAKAIIDTNMAYIAEYIDAAARHFEGRFSVCMAGSVGTDPVSMNFLHRHLHCDVNVFPLTEEPVFGALIIAKNLSESRK